MSHRYKIKTGKDSSGSEFVSGQIMVTFKDGVTEQQVQDFLTEKKFAVINVIENLGIYLLGVPEGQEEALVAELQTHALVEAAELNGVMHAC